MKIQEVSFKYDTRRDDLCVEMTQKLYNIHRTPIEISKSLYTRKINILFYRIKDTYCCSFEFNCIRLLFSFPYVRVYEKYAATAKYKKETTTKCTTALKRRKTGKSNDSFKWNILI